jgi:formiminotetrahydrofolate cyclodeaminase
MPEFKVLSCEDFTEALASGAPVPGGGAACAFVGAMATALGGMVGSLTIGKPRYEEVSGEVGELKRRADALRVKLLNLMDKDAAAFEPLARAYGLPAETEEERAEKARVTQDCLRAACTVPLEIMEACCEALDLLDGFAHKGAAIAISDAGVGLAFAKAALQGASLNVFINTKAMVDREYATMINMRAKALLDTYLSRADTRLEEVANRLAWEYGKA